MSLKTMLVDPNASLYYDSHFRQVIEDHLSTLRGSVNTRTVTIKPDVAVQNEFDFYGLLQSLAIPHQLHWIIMRLNNFHSPVEMSRDVQNILIPDFNEISGILTSYNAIQSRLR